MEVRVQAMLADIQPLIAKRDLLRHQEAAASAARVQNEIFRRFALVDWQTHLEGQSNPYPTAGELQYQQQLRKRVEDGREEAKATLHALAETKPLLSISPPVQEPEFHAYLQLPGPIVRQNILSWLTSPQDKLNLLAAMPEEGDLMGCTEELLRCELEMDTQVNRENGWKTLMTEPLMPNGNTSYQRLVSSKFNQFLVNNLDLLSIFEITASVERQMFNEISPQDLLATAANVPQLPANPDLSLLTINLKILADGNDHILPALQRFGFHIWDLQVLFTSAMTPVQMLEQLRTIFKLTPNIRRLLLLQEDDFDLNPVGTGGVLELKDDLLRAWQQMEHEALPGLRYLKSVGLEACGERLSLVKRKVLEIYGPQLKNVALASFYFDFPVDVPYQLPVCPALSNLLIRTCENGNIAYYLEMFSKFAGSPVKTVQLLLNLRAEENASIGDLFHCLSTCFGTTLTELDLQTLALDHQHIAPQENDLLPEFPVLSKLTAKVGVGHHSILGWLRQSPLKVVEIGSTMNHSEQEFAMLLRTLSYHFGNTLEELDCVYTYTFTFRPPNIEFMRLTSVFLPSLNFPKVKILRMNIRPEPDSWHFLLLFPALETLTLTKRSYPEGHVHGDNIVNNLVDTSNSGSRLHLSNIWKLLPELNQLTWRDEWRADNQGPNRQETITRKDCIARFQ